MGKAVVTISKEYLASVIPLPEGSHLEECITSDKPFAFSFVVSAPYIENEDNESLPNLEVAIEVGQFGELNSFYRRVK